MKRYWNNNKPKSTVRKSEYEEVPTRKLISAYGGVGSVVETRKGAILIESFAKWPYFKTKLSESAEIEDQRLLNRLRIWFPKLTKLLPMPQNQLDDFYKPRTCEALVSAQYFPKWMFSTKSHRFDYLESWVEKWRNNVDDADKDKFMPPKCWVSYCEAKDKKAGKKFYELEQVRFIMISSSGKIADVPWDYWIFGKIEKRKDAESTDVEPIDEAEKGTTRLDFKAVIPENIYFEYHVSGSIGDFAGISIRAFDKTTKKEIRRRTLQGLLSLRISESHYCPKGQGAKDPDAIWKAVIRSSNSVYYPNITNSLYLPNAKSEVLFSEEEIVEIKLYQMAKLDLNAITVLINQKFSKKSTVEQIEKLITNNFEQKPEEGLAEALEADYRRSEYLFITSQSERYVHEKNWLVIEPVALQFTEIKQVYSLDRLKLTSVQTSFTRQEPIDRDSYFQDDTLKGKLGAIIKKKYTHGWKPESIQYFPAVESFGEGIFIDFDVAKISSWQSEHSNELNKRIGWIQKNFDENKFDKTNRTITAQFVLIHTFCHIIIKELEFLCGYPASSLQERLYIGDDMNGFLIYTIAGAEGSYGGLVSLVKSDKFSKVIQSALHRATDCSSDPICYHTNQQGQGVGGTNLAACYACTLLPETSCEEFNRFLDRYLIVSENIGYFRDSLSTILK